MQFVCAGFAEGARLVLQLAIGAFFQPVRQRGGQRNQTAFDLCDDLVNARFRDFIGAVFRIPAAVVNFHNHALAAEAVVLRNGNAASADPVVLADAVRHEDGSIRIFCKERIQNLLCSRPLLDNIGTLLYFLYRHEHPTLSKNEFELRGECAEHRKKEMSSIILFYYTARWNRCQGF